MAREDEQTVDVDELKAYVLRKIEQGWRVSLAGRVTSFARDTARVAADMAARFLDTTRQYRAEQPVTDAPVVHPGGDGYGFFFDLAPDDPVVLLAGDAPTRGFWETGGVVDPTSPGHTYGCAVAFPGGRVSSSVPGQATPAPNAAGECLLGAKDGTSGVRLRRARPDAAPPELGTTIVEAAGPLASLLLGSADAAVPAACAPQVDANFDLIGQVFQGLPAVPGDPGIIAALKTAFGVAYTAALQQTADAKARFDGPAPPP